MTRLGHMTQVLLYALFLTNLTSAKTTGSTSIELPEDKVLRTRTWDNGQHVGCIEDIEVKEGDIITGIEKQGLVPFLYASTAPWIIGTLGFSTCGTGDDCSFTDNISYTDAGRANPELNTKYTICWRDPFHTPTKEHSLTLTVSVHYDLS